MTYRILDEPRPGGLAHLAVNPLWPLLAVMLGGVWLSWPWFVLNSFAVGSPTRFREFGLAVGGLFGSVAVLLTINWLRLEGVLDNVAFSYAVVALVVWKLLISYWLYILQARTFGLYEYFGGAVRNGALVAVLSIFLRPRVLEPLPGFLQVILG